jgi:hypothetical protein
MVAAIAIVSVSTRAPTLSRRGVVAAETDRRRQRMSKIAHSLRSADLPGRLTQRNRPLRRRPTLANERQGGARNTHSSRLLEDQSARRWP